MRLLDVECHERRMEMYRHNQLALEQSQRELIDKQWTYEGPEEAKDLVKTVVKQRSQPISVGALREMRLLNNEMQWSGRASGVRQLPGSAAARTRVGSHREAHTSRSPGSDTSRSAIPLPAGLRKEDEPLWPKLMREEQELAAQRLGLYPQIPLDRARVPPGPLWSYYPWRTEAEHNVALLASLVVIGQYSIEEFFQHLEVLELSKPFAHPNLLTKDHAGRWKLCDPKQIPLPVMPAERAALPEESPERIYWPNQSKAEHYALMRAEMVLRGHLSRDQYDSLNAWASWCGPCRREVPMLQALSANLKPQGVEVGRASCRERVLTDV